jgi:hypothetical protein
VPRIERRRACRFDPRCTGRAPEGDHGTGEHLASAGLDDRRRPLRTHVLHDPGVDLDGPRAARRPARSGSERATVVVVIDEGDALGWDHAKDEARQCRIDRRQSAHRGERADGAGQLRQVGPRPQPADVVGIENGVVERHFRELARVREAAERYRAPVQHRRGHALVLAGDEQRVVQPDFVAGPERPARERQAVDEQRRVPIDGLEGEISAVQCPDAAAALTRGSVFR